MKKTAMLVRDHLADFTGHAALYMVDPSVEYGYDDNAAQTIYVVASATILPLGMGTETYLFPADADGNILDWGELDGSIKNTLDHRQALENGGYEVISGLLIQ